MDEQLLSSPDAKAKPAGKGSVRKKRNSLAEAGNTIRRASIAAAEQVTEGLDTIGRKARRASMLAVEGMAGVDPDAEGISADLKPKITTEDATTAMILNCVGAGVTVFSKVMADMGFIVTPLLSFGCALLILECGSKLADACTLCEDATGKKITSFEELAEGVAGKTGKMVVVLTKNFALTGFLIVYMQFVIEGTAVYFPGETPADKPMSMIRYCLVLPVFILLSMVTNLQQLAKFATAGTLAVVIECGGIIGGGLWHLKYEHACTEGDADPECLRYSERPAGGPPDWLGPSGSAVAVFLFTFAILTTVPTVRSQLEKPKEMPIVLRKSFITVAFINIVVMTSGYIGYGQVVADNIIPQLALTFPVLGSVSAASIVFSLLYSSVLVCFCVICIIESFMKKSAIGTPLSAPNIFLRIGYVSSLAVIGSTVPFVMQVIGLVSSVFSVVNNIFLPVGLFYMAHRMKKKVMETEPIPFVKRIVHILAILIGLFVMVFGFMGSLKTLLNKIHAAEQ